MRAPNRVVLAVFLTKLYCKCFPTLSVSPVKLSLALENKKGSHSPLQAQAQSKPVIPVLTAPMQHHRSPSQDS